jgi:mannose-6-phosphate isomerase-like protein (cupin superfamily)
MTDPITTADLISMDDLPGSATAYRFEGHRFGGVDVSFFLIAAPPGHGPRLHRHPYEEVFVVQEGRATFTVGDETIDATGGQIVVAPAGCPHKFVNSGAGTLRQVNIHPRGRMAQEDLEPEAGT